MPSFSLLRRGSRDSPKKDQQVVHIGQLQELQEPQEPQEPPSPRTKPLPHLAREQSPPQQQQQQDQNNAGSSVGGSATVPAPSPVGSGISWSPSVPPTSQDNEESGSVSGAGSGSDSPMLAQGNSNKQERRNSRRDLLHDLISRGRIIGKQAATPLRGRRMSSQPPPPQRDANGLVSPQYHLFRHPNFPHQSAVRNINTLQAHVTNSKTTCFSQSSHGSREARKVTSVTDLRYAQGTCSCTP